MRLGIIKEIFQMALDSIRAHKLRSFLTLLGITIGVMTVIGMVSIIQGLNRSILAELESVGSDIIQIQKYDAVQMGERTEEERQRKDLTLEDAEAIEKECPLVKAVAVDIIADIFEFIPVKYQNTKVQDHVIIGMNEKWPQVISIYLPTQGRAFTESDITHTAKVCVLGSEIAETLFPHTDPIQKEIRIGPEKFRVIGVLAERGSISGKARIILSGSPLPLS